MASQTPPSTTPRTKTARQKAWQGQNWCRPSTRLAIYLRDGLACVWCGSGVEQGTQLSLDHVKPHKSGGTNEPTNLVTSCSRCNSSRGTRGVAEFARAVAIYLDHGVDPRAIVRHVANCRDRELPRAQARTILERRGTVAQALTTMTHAEG